MNSIIAIIDIGTNTFRLIIVHLFPETKGFKFLHEKRFFVKLAEEGLTPIGKEPFLRGILALESFSNLIKKFKVNKVVALATEGLRKASNGAQFIESVKERSGIEIRCISGDTEALLISRGVKFAGVPSSGLNLIMDIGGGSTEFIITENSEIKWKASFPLGAAILKSKFHHSNPISSSEIKTINNHFEEVLRPLLEHPLRSLIKQLVGCSGSFSTFYNLLKYIDSVPQEDSIISNPKLNEIENKQFFQLDEKTISVLGSKLLSLPLKERLRMNGMPENRAEMMPVAYLLIAFIQSKFEFDSIIYSSYAVKEGVLWSELESELY